MRNVVPLVAIVAAALGVPSPAAAQIMIAPTTIAIEPDRRSAVVIVENGSDEAIDVQMRLYDWTQPDGGDSLAVSTDLMVSPAIAAVPAHGKQVFRLLLAGPGQPPSGGERAWRLRLNQLPRDGRRAVAINLEFMVPVFQGVAGATPRLAWRWTRDGRVAVTNTGDRRARFSRLALAGDGGPPVELAGGASTYLLSGATRIFTPAAPAPAAARARLIATGDTGPLDAMPAALAAR